MRTIKITSQKNKKVHGPENWDEVTVGQFQQIISSQVAGVDWKDQDWVNLFCILYNQDYNQVSGAVDSGIADSLYDCIAFVLYPNVVLEDIPLPKEINMQPVWSTDNNDTGMMTTTVVNIPKEIGGMTVGQLIQARKTLEGLKDIREGLSMVTAIFLQPLIDAGKTDHRGKPLAYETTRVFEVEAHIQKMSITKIFPIGFFLFKRLRSSGHPLTKLWNLMKTFLHSNGAKV